MRNVQQIKPPRVAEQLFRWLLHQDYGETTLGDMAEIYQDIAIHESRARAYWWYWRQCIASLPAFIGNSMYWSVLMLKSYFKIAYRNLFKNKLFAVINVLGLALAIGCSIVVYVFIEDQYGRDAFHENGERIFMAENVINRNGQQQLWGDSPMPLGPALLADFPQVKRAVRIDDRRGTVRYGDKVFSDRIRFVSPDFLHMFTFPLKYGNKDALQDESAIILSEQRAIRLFGEENPMGKQISIKFSDEHIELFTVRGVAEKFPLKASFGFEYLVNFNKLLATGMTRLDDWKDYTHGTFIELHDAKDISVIAAGMDKYIQLQNSVNAEWPVAALPFDNLLDLSMKSYQIRRDISDGSTPHARYILSLVGTFLLLLACFNYMNIAVASAARRLKEIGIRKVVGSRKFQLVNQFLGENILTCFLALILGVVLAKFFFLPGFNHILLDPGENQLTLNVAENIWIWVFFAGLLMFTGLVAGAYPAFYISKFQPVSIFRGTQKFGGRNLLTRALLTFQFVISFLLISASIIFAQNAAYQASLDWGYNQEEVVVVPLNGKSQYAQFRNEVMKYPHIMEMAGSQNHIGYSRNVEISRIEGKEYEIYRLGVDHNYFNTMGVNLKSGRLFEADLQTDDRNIIINEELAKQFDWDEPIGQQIYFDSAAYYVVGVVENYHHDDFEDKIDPTMFRLQPDEAAFRYLSVRAGAGKVIETADHLKATWKQLFPDDEYRGFIQSDTFEDFYREIDGIKTFFIAIAVIALVISCMGLFGLVSLIIAKRMKEMSIRKVLGANILHVSNLINKQFVYLLLLASIIAAPVGYFMLKGLLDDVYAYHVTITQWPFLFAMGLLFLTAIVTVSSQIYKMAVSNPVDALRNE